MNKDIIIALLQNIKLKSYVGAAGLDAITYAINNGLIERTESGNFKLSQKGEDLVKGKFGDKTISGNKKS